MKTNNIKRTIEVDMSPEAIDRRLRDVSQLYKLGQMIKTAKKIGKVKDFQNNNSK